ncbi:hypothetical protein F4804DRAFT_93108 [Jackrogersella minutella]|nr:hypothetical protein F4804DRAFT_93108 [Jackrogersella minutella]
MPKFHRTNRAAADTDSSDDSVDEVKDEEEVDDVPVRSSQSVSTRFRRAVLDDDDDDVDDDAPIVPQIARKRQRPTLITIDDDEEDEDDDEPIIPSSSLKRSRPNFVELEDSSDEVASPAKKARTSLATPGRLKRPNSLASSSPIKKGLPKGRRSEKQKKMELLRRRRAGEKIDKLTSSEEEESDQNKRGIYDTDSEEEFGALKEFDDEDSEEQVVVAEVHRPSMRVEKSARRSQKEGEDEEEDDDMGDFLTDDDDAPIGAPADLAIPLEFTAQAHRPLKDQFPYAIEWLVHNRINPAFERNDPVYANAWRKLDDEVHALASSKFASSAWKPEFYRALKGRPKMLALEVDEATRNSTGIYNKCEACGRSKHPAKMLIHFSGHPYYKNTLTEVESDSDSDGSDNDDDDGDDSGHESVDTQGMALSSVAKVWHVGIVCCSNAEAAHSLIHWKHALKEWVEDRLELDGWMDAKKLKERERMKARKRRDLANRIADGWREKKIVTSLYREFKNRLEVARNHRLQGRPTRGWYSEEVL